MPKKAKVTSFADLGDLLEVDAELGPVTAIKDESAAADFSAYTGKAMTISLRQDIADDQFAVTGMLRGIMGNLDYSRVQANRRLDDLDSQSDRLSVDGTHQGLSDAQQMFAENLLTQLSNIADLTVDLEEFWGSVCDNPNLKLHPRSDADILRSIIQSEQRKEEERVAHLRKMSRASAGFDRADIQGRRTAIAARTKQ